MTPQEKVANMRKCATPQVHATFQEPKEFGNLCVPESLDPKDVLRYTRCGLCAGVVEIFPYKGK